MQELDLAKFFKYLCFKVSFRTLDNAKEDKELVFSFENSQLEPQTIILLFEIKILFDKYVQGAALGLGPF